MDVGQGGRRQKEGENPEYRDQSGSSATPLRTMMPCPTGMMGCSLAAALRGRGALLRETGIKGRGRKGREAVRFPGRRCRGFPRKEQLSARVGSAAALAVRRAQHGRGPRSF
jgi:hypothetical protein